MEQVLTNADGSITVDLLYPPRTGQPQKMLPVDEAETVGAYVTPVDIGTTGPGAAPPSSEGFGSFFEGLVAGSFAENDSWSATAGSVIGGLISSAPALATRRKDASSPSMTQIRPARRPVASLQLPRANRATCFVPPFSDGARPLCHPTRHGERRPLRPIASTCRCLIKTDRARLQQSCVRLPPANHPSRRSASTMHPKVFSPCGTGCDPHGSHAGPGPGIALFPFDDGNNSKGKRTLPSPSRERTLGRQGLPPPSSGGNVSLRGSIPSPELIIHRISVFVASTRRRRRGPRTTYSPVCEASKRPLYGVQPWF
jgi:hypothetical protein